MNFSTFSGLPEFSVSLGFLSNLIAYKSCFIGGSTNKIKGYNSNYPFSNNYRYASCDSHLQDSNTTYSLESFENKIKPFLIEERLSRIKRHVIGGSPLGACFFGTYRLAITAISTIMTVVDYKLNYDKDNEEAQHRLHCRGAKRLVRVCRKHGGVYTKLGQYISTLKHVLPNEYISEASQLTDKAESLPWSEISTVLQEELELSVPNISHKEEILHSIFSEVDELPIAAASLAQVHRGVCRRTGKEVAIKIQYPHLRAQTKGDMRTLKQVVRFIGWLFPQYEFLWIFPEFEQNLCQELDFRQEAFNAVRVARQLEHRADVHIPTIDWNLTSSRCLVMEYIRGFKVTDQDMLEKNGIHPKKAADLFCDVFGEMLHIHGFIHCDPHPGNILLRLIPAKKIGFSETNILQLVILDHGMYRRLDPHIRLGYCRLWKSLLMRHRGLGVQACQELKIPETFLDILSLLFTYRIPNNNCPTASYDSPEQYNILNSQTSQLGLSKINDFLSRLPRDILWVLRSTNIVRSVNLQLGGTTQSRLFITGRCALQGIQLNSIDPINNEDLKQVESLILKTLIHHRYYQLNLQQLKILTETEFSWTPGDSMLGPLYKKRLLQYVVEQMNPNHSQKSMNNTSQQKIMSTLCEQGHLPPPLNTTLDKQTGSVMWYTLPGAATLNLPVYSELVMWKEYKQRRTCNHWTVLYRDIILLWRYSSIQLEKLYFNIQLWGLHIILSLWTNLTQRIFAEVISTPVLKM